MKGIGTVVAATLLAEASQPLNQRDYHSLRFLCGTAAVTRRIGKTIKVQMRYACNQRLRNAVYHWARVASVFDPLSKHTYASLRRRGHTHARALRTIGDQLLNILCAMLRDGTFYDPTKRKSYQTLANTA
jgi:transposase